MRKNYLGIDLASGRRRFVFAALDEKLNLLALANGSLSAALAFAAGQANAVAAINIPISVEKSNEQPRNEDKTYTQLRLEEIAFRQRGFIPSETQPVEKQTTIWKWNRRTFLDALRNLDYQKAESKDDHRVLIQTHAEEAYFYLAGHTLYPPDGLEGRLQRQLFLFEEGLGLDDPLRFLEEFTRHKLLNGSLPLGMIYTPAELSAMICAYTAWLSDRQPERILAIGDKEEELIVLPQQRI